MKKYINTVSKGDSFEDRSLGIIKRVIAEEQLGHLSRFLKIYTKKDKGYYSHKRKKDIYFDLTIEVWPPGAKRYTLIYIIECKNYSKRIPVDDIEEFHSKIQQVSGVNVKGIFISNAALQEGGFNIADSIGMMVIQGESSNDYNIILHKKNISLNTRNLIPIINGTKKENLFDEGVKMIEGLLDNKLMKCFVSTKEGFVSYNIDKLSKEDIESKATEILNLIDPNVITKGHSMSFNKLKEYIEFQEDIQILNFVDKSNILGWCNLKEKKIGINPMIKSTSRELFVLAHEFGHYILHQKLIISQCDYDSFSDSEYNFKTARYDLNNPKNWIEWQANHFASSLIIPKPQFLARLWWCQDKLGISQGKFYLDDQYSNIKTFRELVEKMSYILNVTKTTVIYKLKEMKLLEEKSRVQSVGQIISGYKENLYM